MSYHGKALPLEAWPPADRAAWLAETAKGHILDQPGAAAHLSDSFLADLQRRYGRLLGYINWRGRLDRNAEPAGNLTPELLGNYVSDLESSVGSVTTFNSVHKAMRVAEYIAPARDWSWLRRLSRRLARKQRPANKRARLVDSARLFQLGTTLMAEAEAPGGALPLAVARRYRDGMMIALLAFCPLRLANFTSLALGESLVRIEDGWSITIARSQSKTGRPIEISLPDELLPYLVRYLECYRPRFSSAEQCSAVWLSSRGGALSYSSVQIFISSRTKTAFGKSVSPHLFRHCAATTVAIRDGARMGVVVALLGHRHSRLLDRHYNLANTVSAVLGYQEILDALRNEEPQKDTP